MAKKRVRVQLPGIPTEDYWKEKEREGWRLIAVEWEREVSAGEAEGYVEEVPYGLQVSEDGVYLVENPEEMEVLAIMREYLISDATLSQTAAELNRRGLGKRDGSEWNAVDVFELMPRQIDASPRIHTMETWPERRQRALRIVK